MSLLGAGVAGGSQQRRGVLGIMDCNESRGDQCCGWRHKWMYGMLMLIAFLSEREKALWRMVAPQGAGPGCRSSLSKSAWPCGGGGTSTQGGTPVQRRCGASNAWPEQPSQTLLVTGAYPIWMIPAAGSAQLVPALESVVLPSVALSASLLHSVGPCHPVDVVKDFPRSLPLRLMPGRACLVLLVPPAARCVVPPMRPPHGLGPGLRRNIRRRASLRRRRSILAANVLLQGIRRRPHAVKVARRAGPAAVLPTRPLTAPTPRLCTRRTAVVPLLRLLWRSTRPRRLWRKEHTLCWPLARPVVAWPTVAAARLWSLISRVSRRAQPDRNRRLPMRRRVVRLRISRRRSTRSRACWRLRPRRRRRWRKRSHPAGALTRALQDLLQDMKGNIMSLGYRRWVVSCKGRKHKPVHPLCKITNIIENMCNKCKALRTPATSFGLCVIQTVWWKSLLRWNSHAKAVDALQPRGEIGPAVEPAHLVAGVPIHVVNGLRVVKAELLHHEDETSSLADQNSKTRRWPPRRATRHMHQCLR